MVFGSCFPQHSLCRSERSGFGLLVWFMANIRIGAMLLLVVLVLLCCFSAYRHKCYSFSTGTSVAYCYFDFTLLSYGDDENVFLLIELIAFCMYIWLQPILISLKILQC